MSKTDKTDPFWVKHNNTTSYKQDHSCADHGARWGGVSTPCDLPESVKRARPDGHVTRDPTRCTWEPRWHRGDWDKAFARWGGSKYHRKDWYSRDRAVNRRALRVMIREASSGIDRDCLSEDSLDLRPHRHTPMYGGGWLD